MPSEKPPDTRFGARISPSHRRKRRRRDTTRHGPAPRDRSERGEVRDDQARFEPRGFGQALLLGNELSVLVGIPGECQPGTESPDTFWADSGIR